MAGTITLTTDGGTGGNPLSLSIDAGAVTIDGQTVTPEISEPITGLVFPSNGTSNPVAFEFAGAGNYPDIVPLTVMVKHYPVQQAGYYTTFFHGPDATFTGGLNYFGCHPWPPGGSSGTTHNWEVSIEGDDRTTDANGNSTTVTKDAWYSQAASSRHPDASHSTIDFYWNLAVDSDRRISWTTVNGRLQNAASPALTFGDAPWSPGNECLSGRLRGLQIYNSQLSEADIEALHVCDTNAEVLAVCASRSITSLWYLNMNPTPDDITDKSGEGHNPAWLNANRPTLWEG